MKGRNIEGRRIAARLLRSFQFLKINPDGFGQRSDVDPEVNRSVGRDFFQSHTPQLDRARRNSLLPLEISGGDLNDPLVKKAILAMIFQPDFFERLVALEEELLIELVDAFLQARIVLGSHRWMI